MRSKLKFVSLLAGGAAGAFALRKQVKNLEPKTPSVTHDTVILYQFDYSPYCAKVRYILDYKKVPYQCVELLPMVHASFTKRLSGQSKVPYIRHQGQIIADSSSIALYLEELQPEPSLFPGDAQEREQILLLEDWLDEAFQGAIGKFTYLSLYLNPERAINNPDLNTGVTLIDQHKDKIVPMMLGMNLRKNKLSPSDLPRLKNRVNEVFERLSGQLKGREYLVGSQLSLADITLVSHLTSCKMLPEIAESADLAWLFEWREGILAEIQSGQTVKA